MKHIIFMAVPVFLALFFTPFILNAEQKPIPVAIRTGSCGGILGCTGYMIKNDGTISSYKFGNVTKVLCNNVEVAKKLLNKFRDIDFNNYSSNKITKHRKYIVLEYKDGERTVTWRHNDDKAGYLNYLIEEQNSLLRSSNCSKDQ